MFIYIYWFNNLRQLIIRVLYCPLRKTFFRQLPLYTALRFVLFGCAIFLVGILQSNHTSLQFPLKSLRIFSEFKENLSITTAVPYFPTSLPELLRNTKTIRAHTLFHTAAIPITAILVTSFFSFASAIYLHWTSRHSHFVLHPVAPAHPSLPRARSVHPSISILNKFC